MDWGASLEDEAIEEFERITGKLVDKVGFIEKEDNEFMGCSPDGLIMNDGKYTEALEIKCLTSKHHLCAIDKNKVPDEYFEQVIQYFIINPDLETLYFFLYDPRLSAARTHIIPVYRKDVQETITEYEAKEKIFIDSINTHLEKFVTL